MLIQKKRGNFLEDFRVGQLFRHKVGKTVTEGLFNAFTEFGMTTNPLYKNLRYAQRYGFRGLIAPPGLVMNIVFSQSVEDISEHFSARCKYGRTLPKPRLKPRLSLKSQRLLVSWGYRPMVSTGVTANWRTSPLCSCR